MTPPNATQLKVLQTGAMRTRLDSSPRKKADEGYGYGRVCEDQSCIQVLNHFNPGPLCNVCERRLERERRDAA